MKPKNTKDQIKAILQAHPGQWINELNIAQELGIMPGKVSYLTDQMLQVLKTTGPEGTFYKIWEEAA